MKIPNALVGAAGEYLIAAELSQRGWLATVTIKNAPGTDVLAQHYVHRRVVAIQSKTNRGASHWILGEGDEQTTTADHEWYVLVRLGGGIDAARFFVLPRSHVAACVWVSHRRWLLGAKRDGNPRKDSSMRQIFLPGVAPYEDAWHLLEHPTTAVDPNLLPASVIEGAQDAGIGLPVDHPLVDVLPARAMRP